MPAPEPAYALVVSGDSNPAFARGLAVTIRSALAHLDAGCRPVIYVLDCGLPDGAVQRLRHVAARVRPDVDVRVAEVATERLDAVPNRSIFPSVVFARLLIDEFLDASVQRVIYLDADVLVHRDVSPLFTLDLAGAPIAAVRDLHKRTPDGDPSRPYFNSGVLAIDIAAWRAAMVRTQALRYIESRNSLPMGDQDALNAVISEWHPLEYRWNLQLGALLGGQLPGMPEGWMSREDLTKLRRALGGSLAISHFTVRKPWLASHGPPPGSARWAVCFARTGWLPPVQAGVWLVRWMWARTRHAIGTARLRLLHAQ